ncbi:MAG TPA: nucleoside-diphosphate sugar epimerase/dehydratase [Bryobacteraceae bacterium]|nr:nucleoside-diphosphate sugar epimerase/dehydratase [Bryobacteraceae bacterium]
MKYLRRPIVLATYLLIAAASVIGAYLLRFEFSIPHQEYRVFLIGLAVFVPVKVVVFYVLGVHRSWWRMVSILDLLRLIVANSTASFFAGLGIVLLVGSAFPRSIYIMDGILCFLMTAALQFCRRVYAEALAAVRYAGPRKRILIYGAGAAGIALAKEIRSNSKLGIKIAGFLDDDPEKRHLAPDMVPVLGTGRDAARVVTRFARRGSPVSEIVIAMPSANGRQMRSAIANCRAAGIVFKTVPGLGELLNGKVLTGQIRDVSVNDLLGREPVQIDETMIGREITGRSVLVTGAAGSIGSELCRQLARFDPEKLVLFDQAESELFMLALELRRRFQNVNIIEEIGDIGHRVRLDEVMSGHNIEAVFHAAAYKHVPMMEANILEAAANNVIGTYNVAQAAYDHGVGKFLMISSDKAVNPTSMMGVTKRVAELLLAEMPLDCTERGTAFVSVRFGNVLGSKGSVVPIFQQQIANGGPVTVTHPDMRRYFMSIPEAVQLVLQAYAMGQGSEVFVLDMGEPVKIVDLARNMIRLAGFVPDDDIEIRFTGMRPGEKLFEELTMDGEDVLPTYHNKIKIFRSYGPTKGYLAQWVRRLNELLRHRDSAAVQAHLLDIVPEYRGTAVTTAATQDQELAAVGD